MGDLYVNDVATTLASSATAVATSLSITSATGLPTMAAGDTLRARLEPASPTGAFELALVTARSGTTLTVTRGQEGTTAAAWAAGDRISFVVTADAVLNLRAMVVTYTGSLSTARPSASLVVWEGFPSQPTNMAAGDLWLDTSGGAFLTGTATPTGADGNDGDMYLRTSTSTLYGPKASGSWPSGVSLVGPTGATGSAGTSGVVSATAPATYNSGTQTIGVTLGTSSTSAAAGNDSRFTDARTPTAHASTHASGGSDPVTLAESQVTNLTTDLAAKAPLASPVFTGNPTAPTPTAGDNDTSIATTAFVTTAVAGGGGGGGSLTVQEEGSPLTTAATTLNFVGPSVTAAGTTATKTITVTPVDRAALMAPTGAIRASTDRSCAQLGSGTYTSGTLYLVAVLCFAGDVLSTVNVRSAASGWGTVTHSWAVLLDTGLNVLAVSSDDTTATLAANTNKAFNLGSSYTVTSTGIVYAGLMVAGGTITTLGQTVGGVQQVTVPPILGGSSSSAQTTPPSIGATMATLTPQQNPPPLYTWLT